MANYPRQLVLSQEIEDKLKAYLDDELSRHYMERGQMIDELKQMQTDYWAKPSAEVKKFPFKGAANIIIPLTAIAVETIHARTMQTISAVNPLVTVKAKNPQLTTIERPLENFVHHELVHSVQWKKPIDSIVLETEKFGTGIGSSGYECIIKKAIRTSPDGQREEEIPVIVKNGATLDFNPQANFLMPFGAKDPQTAPWVGEEQSRTPYEVRSLELSGYFKPGTYEKVLPFVTEYGNDGQDNELTYERTLEQLEKRVSSFKSRINWKHLWLCFDIDGDNYEEEIVVDYHKAARIIMSIRHNWYADLRRKYRVGNYMTVEGRWRGIGICKQNEQFQRSVTTQHRQGLDNGTVANMRMFKIHKFSGYGPQEPIFPGKMWFVDDMSYIDSVEMGDVRQSSFAHEQSTVIFSHQRSGVNEAVLGMPQQGTPGTATSDLARIQEGNKKFDFYYANMKQLASDLFFDVFCNIQQFGPKNVDYFKYTEGGEQLVQLMNFPPQLIRDAILIELGAAGVQQNRLLDRQNWMQVAQVLQSYYASMLQLATMSGNPQIIQMVLLKGFKAATEALRQILESYDIRNIDRLVLSELEKMLQQMELANAAGNNGAIPVGGGNNRVAGNGQASGMDFLAQAMAALRG